MQNGAKLFNEPNVGFVCTCSRFRSQSKYAFPHKGCKKALASCLSSSSLFVPMQQFHNTMEDQTFYSVSSVVLHAKYENEQWK